MKRRDHYTDLKTLVGRLREDELKVARKFIVAFETNATAKNNKGLKLLTLLAKAPHLDREKARKRINRDMDAESFDKMVKRLMDKLLESLILDINTNRKDAYSGLFKTKFSLRKKMMQTMVVAGRGMSAKYTAILDRIIADAKKFELYDELLEALTQRSFIHAMQLEEKDRQQVLSELGYYQRCLTALNKAKSWYYEHYAQTGASGLVQERIGLLTEALSYLQDEYKETGSANVGYYLYFLEKEYFQVVEQYPLACDTGLRLLKLIEESPAIYTRHKLAGANLHLADSELFAYRFESSAHHATRAVELYNAPGFNTEYAIETRVKAHIYQNDLAPALQEINELLQQTDQHHNHYHFARRNYLKACVLFMMRDYKYAFLALQQDTREIEKDKDGWNVGIRVLSILCCIERYRLDSADNHIANFKKHVERLDAMSDLRERDRIILKLLVSLERNNFDFVATMQQHKDDLLALHSVEKDYRWEVNTWEFIVFHHWFEAQVRNQAYAFEVPAELEEWVAHNELPDGYGPYAFTSNEAQDTDPVEPDAALVPVRRPEPRA